MVKDGSNKVFDAPKNWRDIHRPFLVTCLASAFGKALAKSAGSQGAG